MRIKRVEMHGFKSFADKTEVELGDGLTAVVGPNGSGKSNLAEAVKWVLGEQSARVLRGQKMDDIIFSGTAKRKGVGFAEVSLVFDNTSERLAIDFSEVAITRRVYRSGEGEYFINRKACRLKDITELFLDTGIGKDTYSFIGQGRIDEILNADPHKRRAIFEEAAGISRYKLRKRETEQRLHETTQNLRRVEDIEAELKEQLEPLRFEARQAEVYLGLDTERKKWEKELHLYELSLAERQEQSLKTQLERMEEETLSLENKQITLEAQRSQLALEQSSLVSAISDLEHRQMQLRVLGEQKEEKQQDLRQKLQDLSRQKIEGEQQLHSLARAEQELEANLAAISAEIAQLSEQRDALTQSLSALPATAAASTRETLQADLEAQLDKLEEAALQQRGELARTNQQLEQYRQEQTRVSQEAEQLHEDMRLQEDKLASLSGECTQCEHDLKLLHARGLEIRQQIAALRKKELELEEQTRQGRTELSRVESRIESLKLAEQQQEGLSRGARYVLGLNLPGVRGAIGNLLKVPRPYEVAIEVALGAAVSDVITDTESIAKRAIAALKERSMGRATFYPLDALRPRPLRALPNSLEQAKGFMGRASQLVEVPDFARPVIDHLLGNVLVVEHLDVATQVARQTGYSFRVITLDGDLIMPGGSMTGGSKSERQGAMLGRKGELKTLSGQKEVLEKKLAHLLSQLESSQFDLAALRDSEEKNQAEVRRQEERIAEHKQTLAIARGQAEHMQQKLESCQLTLRRCHQSILTVTQERHEAEERASQCEKQIEQIHRELQEFKAESQAELKAMQSRIEEQRDLEIALARLESRIEMLDQREIDVNKGLLELRERIRSSKETANDILAQIDALNSRFTQLTEELAAVKEENSQLEQDLEERRNQRSQLQDSERQSLELSQQARKDLDTARQRGHALGIRLAKLQAEAEYLVARFKELYKDEAIATSNLSSRGEAEQQIESLNDRIAALGSVRISSISECQRLEERLDFLGKEQADLVEASRLLNGVIEELDKVMSRRFIDSFNQVRKEFTEVAMRLFGGGAARLSLVDSETPLSSGIEIDVQPPGKRLQNISLLSGGERALAAVALLCAVLRIKPTPFCVLDEIDAALDDANVDRLLPLLRELSTHTQFLMVTHTKGTMLAADVLYGVTMPEQGVSRILSVKVSELTSA